MPTYAGSSVEESLFTLANDPTVIEAYNQRAGASRWSSWLSFRDAGPAQRPMPSFPQFTDEMCAQYDASIRQFFLRVESLRVLIEDPKPVVSEENLNDFEASIPRAFFAPHATFDILNQPALLRSLLKLPPQSTDDAVIDAALADPPALISALTPLHDSLETVIVAAVRTNIPVLLTAIPAYDSLADASSSAVVSAQRVSRSLRGVASRFSGGQIIATLSRRGEAMARVETLAAAVRDLQSVVAAVEASMPSSILMSRGTLASAEVASAAQYQSQKTDQTARVGATKTVQSVRCIVGFETAHRHGVLNACPKDEASRSGRRGDDSNSNSTDGHAPSTGSATLYNPALQSSLSSGTTGRSTTECEWYVAPEDALALKSLLLAATSALEGQLRGVRPLMSIADRVRALSRSLAEGFIRGLVEAAVTLTGAVSPDEAAKNLAVMHTIAAAIADDGANSLKEAIRALRDAMRARVRSTLAAAVTSCVGMLTDADPAVALPPPPSSTPPEHTPAVLSVQPARNSGVSLAATSSSGTLSNGGQHLATTGSGGDAFAAGAARGRDLAAAIFTSASSVVSSMRGGGSAQLPSVPATDGPSIILSGSDRAPEEPTGQRGAIVATIRGLELHAFLFVFSQVVDAAKLLLRGVAASAYAIQRAAENTALSRPNVNSSVSGRLISNYASDVASGGPNNAGATATFPVIKLGQRGIASEAFVTELGMLIDETTAGVFGRLRQLLEMRSDTNARRSINDLRELAVQLVAALTQRDTAGVVHLQVTEKPTDVRGSSPLPTVVGSAEAAAPLDPVSADGAVVNEAATVSPEERRRSEDAAELDRAAAGSTSLLARLRGPLQASLGKQLVAWASARGTHAASKFAASVPLSIDSLTAPTSLPAASGSGGGGLNAINGSATGPQAGVVSSAVVIGSSSGDTTAAVGADREGHVAMTLPPLPPSVAAKLLVLLAGDATAIAIAARAAIPLGVTHQAQKPLQTQPSGATESNFTLTPDVAAAAMDAYESWCAEKVSAAALALSGANLSSGGAGYAGAVPSASGVGLARGSAASLLSIPAEQPSVADIASTTATPAFLPSKSSAPVSPVTSTATVSQTTVTAQPIDDSPIIHMTAALAVLDAAASSQDHAVNGLPSVVPPPVRRCCTKADCEVTDGPYASCLMYLQPGICPPLPPTSLSVDGGTLLEVRFGADVRALALAEWNAGVAAVVIPHHVSLVLGFLHEIDRFIVSFPSLMPSVMPVVRAALSAYLSALEVKVRAVPPTAIVVVSFDIAAAAGTVAVLLTNLEARWAALANADPTQLALASDTLSPAVDGSRVEDFLEHSARRTAGPIASWATRSDAHAAQTVVAAAARRVAAEFRSMLAETTDALQTALSEVVGTVARRIASSPALDIVPGQWLARGQKHILELCKELLRVRRASRRAVHARQAALVLRFLLETVIHPHLRRVLSMVDFTSSGAVDVLIAQLLFYRSNLARLGIALLPPPSTVQTLLFAFVERTSILVPPPDARLPSLLSRQLD